MIFNVVN